MDAPPAGVNTSDMPPVWAFETGANHWEKSQSWPSGCPSGCARATHARSI